MTDQRPPGAILFATTIIRTSDSFLEETAKRAADRGFQVDLICNMATASKQDRPYRTIHDATWGRGFKSPLGTLKSVTQIRRLIKSCGYSIVHTHTPTASAITRIAVATVPKKQRPVIIYTAHGFHFGEGLDRFSNRVAELVERSLLRWTDLLVVINDEDEAWARRVSPAGTRVLRTNGVGINEKFFEVHRSDENLRQAREQLGISVDSFIVLSVGELNANKRQHLAMNAVAGRTGTRTLLVVGEGRLRIQLENLADQLLENHSGLDIQLHGYQKDIIPYLLAADCLLHTSTREGHPLVILEAMAAELPVIAFPIRGCIDSLKEGRGLLAVGGDAIDLALELAKISAGNPGVPHMVRQARIYAEGFHRGSLANETAEIYKSILVR